MGTALVVMVMSTRATSLVADGALPVDATMQGLRWAFAVSALLCVVVLGLVTLLPNRLPEPAATEVEAPEPAAEVSSGAGTV